VFVAIIRQGSLVIPHGATQLQAGDEVLALVHARHVQQLAELIGPTNVER
jgi:Trk K+ transport system NAD-binding subunit